MLARPKIGPTGCRDLPGSRVPGRRSRTTTSSSRKAIGSRYWRSTRRVWRAPIRPSAGVVGPGARAAARSLSRSRVLDARRCSSRDSSRWLRGEQRIEIRVEPHVDVDDGGREVAGPQASTTSTAGASGTMVDVESRTAPVAGDLGGGEERGRVRRGVRTEQLERDGLRRTGRRPRSRRPPSSRRRPVLPSPLGGRTAIDGLAGGSNAHETRRDRRVGDRRRPPHASVTMPRRSSRRAGARRGPGVAELGLARPEVERTAVRVGAGSAGAGSRRAVARAAASVGGQAGRDVEVAGAIGRRQRRGSAKKRSSMPARYGSGRRQPGPAGGGERLGDGAADRRLGASTSAERRLERGVDRVERDEPERPGADRRALNGWSARSARSAVVEQVRRQDRLRRAPGGTRRVASRARTGRSRVDRRDRHVAPRRRAGPGYAGSCRIADREDDVRGRDRLAVVPAGVVPEVKVQVRPPSSTFQRSARSGTRCRGPEPDEAAEHEGDEVPSAWVAGSRAD